MIDLDELVAVLRDGLEPLVRDGLIEPRRADERARNQAQAILGFLAPDGDFVPLVPDPPPKELEEMTRIGLMRKCEKLANIIADDMGRQELEGRVEALGKELAVVEKFREAEGIAADLTAELWELQKQRADANANALANANEEASKFQSIADSERSRRRRLAEANENLTRQLKSPENTLRSKNYDLNRSGAKIAKRLDRAVYFRKEAEANVKHLETSLDAMVLEREEANRQRIALEDKLHAIVAGLEPRPF